MRSVNLVNTLRAESLKPALTRVVKFRNWRVNKTPFIDPAPASTVEEF